MYVLLMHCTLCIYFTLLPNRQAPLCATANHLGPYRQYTDAYASDFLCIFCVYLSYCVIIVPTNLVHNFQRYEESPCLPNHILGTAPDVNGLAVYA